LKQFNNIMPK